MKKLSQATLLALLASAGCGTPSIETASEPITFTPIVIGPIKFCPGTKVTPDLATDGQRIYLDPAVAQDQMAAILKGYRYNDAVPTVAHREGEGREQIYCGCQRVHIETQIDPDGVPRSRPYFLVPNDAPSGDYSVQLQPAGGACATGGIRAAVCPDTGCATPSLMVRPAFVVTTSDRLKINGNSEDNEDNPSEMQFVFASWSGAAFGDGDTLVGWSGSFPGGGGGSSHATNADNTILDAHLPLFAGRETLMTVGECREECVGRPASQEANCLEACNSNQSLGRYNNQLEFAFSGMELDSSPSKAWGVLAGIATGALVCAGSIKVGIPKTGCSAGIGLGYSVADGVNQLLADEDDNLGVAANTSSQSSNWNLGAIQTVKMGGPSKTNGDIDVVFHNDRMAAPRILSYSVKLKSIKVTDSYEECYGDNDVFLNARTALHQGESQLPPTARQPASGTWSFKEGDTKTWPSGLSLGSQTFAAENAPESPFLYVEIGVWEDDGAAKDLMGVHSEVIKLSDYLGGEYQVSEETTPEGYFVRKVKFDRSTSVHGYAGSDNDCYFWAHGWNPNASEGGAQLNYEVELSWLKAPKM